jgi:transposase
MSVYVGIDVSKQTLDIATYPASQPLRLPNTTTGYQQLHAWLQHHDEITQIGLEASGRYGEAVTDFLVAQNYAVSYLNPRQVHAFSQVHLHYHKTDAQDAQLIARYCALFHPDLYRPRSTLRKHLQQRSRRLDQLKKMRQQEVNRLQSGLQDVFTQHQIKATIAYFDTLIEQTRAAVHAFIVNDDRLAHQHRLLLSIPGIGSTTADLILAEIDIDHFQTAPQLAAYIGITPQHFQSGTSVNKPATISKQGNARLRSGLYMPAVVAQRYNPPCHRFAGRLKAKQKHAMVVVIAVMRKLVHQIFGILKSNQPFDPDFGQIP